MDKERIAELNREEQESKDDGFMDFVCDNIEQLKEDFLEEQEDLWYKFKRDEYDKFCEDTNV